MKVISFVALLLPILLFAALACGGSEAVPTPVPASTPAPTTPPTTAPAPAQPSPTATAEPTEALSATPTPEPAATPTVVGSPTEVATPRSHQHATAHGNARTHSLPGARTYRDAGAIRSSCRTWLFHSRRGVENNFHGGRGAELFARPLRRGHFQHWTWRRRQP